MTLMIYDDDVMHRQTDTHTYTTHTPTPTHTHIQNRHTEEREQLQLSLALACDLDRLCFSCSTFEHRLLLLYMHLLQSYFVLRVSPFPATDPLNHYQLVGVTQIATEASIYVVVSTTTYYFLHSH